MTTAAPMPDLTGLDKAQQLHALRQRIATIPGRRDHAPAETEIVRPLPVEASREQANQPAPRSVSAEPAAHLTPRTKTLRTIPTPMPITALLPRGALARGTA